MTKNFKMYIGKNVKCKTKELAKEFLQIAHNNGWEWSNGESLLDRTYWEVYEKYTCYYVGENKEIIFGPTWRLYAVEYEPLCTDRERK